MRKTMTGIAALALLGVNMYAGGPVLAATSQRLIVTPGKAHPGSTLYLSGSRFAPGQSIHLRYTCNAGRTATGTLDSAAHADAAGHIVAFDFHLPASVPMSSTCRLQSGSVLSTRFTILPPTHPLPACDQHMCVQVKAFLTRVRTGAWGQVVITGWPGSIANVTVVRIGKDQHRTLRLDWQGVGAFKVWVAPGLIKGLKASVRVNASLGAASGVGTGTFAVIPGGR